MFSQRVRIGAVMFVSTALAQGCLASSQYDGALDDYSRIAAPSRSKPTAVDDATLQTTELSLAPLVQQVLARNPSIDAAREAWRGALARYPEATSYADTQLTYTVAPLSVVSSEVKFGQGIQVSQALPYPGKRRLRGEIVVAEAEAEREGYRSVRRRLGLMTARLYYEYFLVGRALEINKEHQQLLTKYMDTINVYMSTAKAWLEDAAEVRVGVADLKQQKIDLESRRDVIVAQLNALLHRKATSPLPPPPKQLAPPVDAVAGFDTLRDQAVAARPELRAFTHRVKAATAAVALAKRDYYPDFRLIGSYNGMWARLEHQLMIGVSVDLPVQRGRRDGAVDRTRASLRRVSSLRGSLLDEVTKEVETARRQTVAADDIVKTYRDEILPAARSRITANRAGLPTGRTNFVEVIRAETGLKMLELRYASAIASAYRHRADLAAALGRIPGLVTDGGVR